MMNEKIAEAIKNGNAKELAIYRLIKAEFIKNRMDKIRFDNRQKTFLSICK